MADLVAKRNPFEHLLVLWLMLNFVPVEYTTCEGVIYLPDLKGEFQVAFLRCCLLRPTFSFHGISDEAFLVKKIS